MTTKNSCAGSAKNRCASTPKGKDKNVRSKTTKKQATKKATPKKPAIKKVAKATKTKPDYFIYNEANRKLIKAEKAKVIKLEGYADFGFIIHKRANASPASNANTRQENSKKQTRDSAKMSVGTADGWTITEACSGAAVAYGPTQARTKANALKELKAYGKEKLIKGIRAQVKNHGLANQGFTLPATSKADTKKQKPVSDKIIVAKVATKAPKGKDKTQKKSITDKLKDSIKASSEPKSKDVPQEQSKKGGKPKGTMSMLDAAAKVLEKSKKPMTVKEITQEIFKQKLSASEGRTPHETISSAIGREINRKGKASRFRRADRGLFEVASRDTH